MKTTSLITIQLKNIAWKKALQPYCKTVQAACEAALGKKKAELTVVLANDKFIRTLNRDFRGKDKPTNVLSFPSEEKDYLGDVVLAYETVAREARLQKKTFRDHAAHLMVHGVLHLLGHDHAHDREAETMEALEVKILKKLKVNNPYL